MSHDFPDGPDYNPEPIDDDPWDVPTNDALYTEDPPCPHCGLFWPGHDPLCGPSDATETILSPSDSPTQE